MILEEKELDSVAKRISNFCDTWPEDSDSLSLEIAKRELKDIEGCIDIEGHIMGYYKHIRINRYYKESLPHFRYRVFDEIDKQLYYLKNIPKSGFSLEIKLFPLSYNKKRYELIIMRDELIKEW